MPVPGHKPGTGKLSPESAVCTEFPSGRLLAPKQEVQKQCKDQAQKQTGDDGKIESKIPFLV